MVAEAAKYEKFPKWYSWVKWVLPLAVTLAGGGLMWAGLSGWIGTFGFLDGGIALLSGLEGFSALAMKGALSGFVASAAGLASSAFVRMGLFFVTEDIATHNLNRNAQLLEELEKAQTDLEEEKTKFNEAVAKIDEEKQEALAQYHQLLGRTRGHDKAKPQVPRKRTQLETHSEAANDEAPQRVLGKRKARKN